MSAKALITICELSDGALATSMEVDESSATEREILFASLMDRAIGAGMQAVCKYFQEKEGVESVSGTGDSLDSAITAAANAALAE